METEVTALCSASYGSRTEKRQNSRNGYRERDAETRMGTLSLVGPCASAANIHRDGGTLAMRWCALPRAFAPRVSGQQGRERFFRLTVASGAVEVSSPLRKTKLSQEFCSPVGTAGTRARR
jgi:hypothetical protein